MFAQSCGKCSISSLTNFPAAIEGFNYLPCLETTIKTSPEKEDIDSYLVLSLAFWLCPARTPLVCISSILKILSESTQIEDRLTDNFASCSA
jgi:hypothetical protein